MNSLPDNNPQALSLVVMNSSSGVKFIGKNEVHFRT